MRSVGKKDFFNWANVFSSLETLIFVILRFVAYHPPFSAVMMLVREKKIFYKIQTATFLPEGLECGEVCGG